jgi:hypothetical protein
MAQPWQGRSHRHNKYGQQHSAAAQDDARKYPSKDSVAGFLNTGGFAGGEAGIQQFLRDGKVTLADEATVARRHRTKDVALLVGLIALLAAVGYGLQWVGLVDFGAVDPGAAVESVAEGRPAEAVAAAAPALRLAPPSLALTPAHKAALAAIGIPAGSVLLVKAAHDGVGATARSIGRATKRTAAKVLVLVAAGAAGCFLVLQ